VKRKILVWNAKHKCLEVGFKTIMFQEAKEKKQKANNKRYRAKLLFSFFQFSIQVATQYIQLERVDL